MLSTPRTHELREFYLCGIRTGYRNSKHAEQAAANWDNHTTYDCEYCPSVHHVKADALHSEDKLTAYATDHWNSFITKL